MYTNETTHFGIPKPLGTDLTVPMDYNDAADRVDQALFDASTNASNAIEAAASAVEAAAGAVEDVGDLGTVVNNLMGRTSALETSDIIQDNKIDALESQGATKFDSAGIADPYVNGLTYSVGDIVTYNGQRYKCTTAVTAAEPFDADKWTGEDVQTVLDGIGTPAASDVTLSHITEMEAGNVQDGIAELKSDLTDLANNEIGAGIDLDNYSSSSDIYIFPSDGYVQINETTGATGIMLMGATSGSIPISIGCDSTTGETARYVVFVRKGMKCYTTGASGRAVFYPLQ